MTRLDRFRVQRYGHFEDLTVDLGPGCTVIYGENEAGKSTLLDALSDFLWGFVARNHPREFVYKRNQMQLEATVDHRHSRKSHLYVRQSNKLTCDGEAMADPPWAAELNRSHWDHAYGLNLERLQRGGRAVVGGRDDPGGISFLADTGLPIDEVKTRIGNQQKYLFGTHGNNKNSAIRQLLARLGEIDQRIEEVGASAQDVDRLAARLDELTASLSTNAGLLAAVDDRLQLVRELSHALDDVQRLGELDQQIALLKSDGSVLSQEDTATLREAIDDLAETEADVADLTDGLAKAREQLEGLVGRSDVLERTADIRAAVRELEARRADATVVHDTSAAANHRQEVVRLLDALGQDTDDLEAARRNVMIPTDRHEQLNRQADACDEVASALKSQHQKVREADARLQEESAPAAGSEELIVQMARRDEAWQAIRAPWLTGDLPDDPARVELAVRLDTAIAGADAEAERAAEALEALGVSRGKRQEAQAALAREQSQLATAEAAEKSARKAWVTLAQDCGLPRGTDTEAWRTRADILTRLTQAWHKWQEEELRHQAASARLADFQARVKGLSSLLATPTGDALTDINALDDLLNDAENTETKISGIQKVLDDAGVELKAAAKARERSAAKVSELAGSADAAELLQRSNKYHDLQAQHANTELLIAKATPSIASLAELKSALRERDRTSLQTEEAQLVSQTVAVNAAISEEQRAIGATQSELSNLQHREGTAALLAERQEVCSQITELADLYRNLRVQELILHQYARLTADRSDTPILDRAGAYLNTLTGGRHQGFTIVTDGTEKHLRIQSSVGDTITDTEPAKLSDGTEHQVYFALRLAGIAARQEERRRKGQPTVPVVLDDVFQAFDDERSATALELLAELGREFQIIVMTHERAIYNIAEGMPEVATVRLTSPRALAVV